MRRGSTSFPRQARLVKPSDFRLVFSGSSRFGDDLFTVLAMKTDGHVARLGLAIAKKCAKRAVERNRLKRVVRECFRNHREELCQIDLVVMCRPRAIKATNAELTTSLIKHWRNVNRDRQCAS